MALLSLSYAQTGLQEVRKDFPHTHCWEAGGGRVASSLDSVLKGGTVDAGQAKAAKPWFFAWTALLPNTVLRRDYQMET